MSERDEDFVAYLIVLLALDPQRAEQIERQIRQDWGGATPYIAKRGTIAKQRVLEQVGTRPDRDIIRENGISRRTMYNWIRKKGQQNG